MINIEKILREKGLTEGQINIIKREVRKEFPDDEMMYELHLIRLVHSLSKGYCKAEDLFEPKGKEPVTHSH